MTPIEQLLGKSSDELIAMSDEELDKFLSPYYNVTRPERIVRRTDSNRPHTMPKKLDENTSKGLGMLAQMGFGNLAASVLKGRGKR